MGRVIGASDTQVLREALSKGVNVWYVDASVGSSGDGTSWETAFQTITEAHTAASDGDNIIIMDGTYDENTVTGGLTITKSNLKIIGLSSKGQAVAIVNTNGAATRVLDVSGHFNTFENLQFQQATIIGAYVHGSGNVFKGCVMAQCTDGFDIQVGNNKFIDCFVGIFTGSAFKIASIGTIIENCIILNIAAGTSIGIEITNSAGNYLNVVKDTIIYGVNEGIKTGTDSNHAIFDNISFSGCTTNITDNSSTSQFIKNNEPSLIATNNTVQQDLAAIHTDTGTTLPSTITTLQTDATALIRRAQQSGVNVWFVDANATGAEDGTSWTDAFILPSQAQAVALRGDVVVIMASIYDENAEITGFTIDNDGVEYVGLSSIAAGVVITNSNAGATDACKITGSYNIFRNMTFYLGGATGCHISGGQNHFHNCLATASLTGFNVDGDLTELNNCYAKDNTGAAFRVNDGNAQINNCIATVTAAGTSIGVELVDYNAVELNVIRNMVISGFNEGIVVGTEAPNNTFVNVSFSSCTTNITNNNATTSFINCSEESEITADNTIQQDLKDIHTDTKFLVTNAISGHVEGSIANTVIGIEREHHTRETWLGISADQSGNDWALDTLTPFQAISGANVYGADANDEAKVLGSDDTPIRTGKDYFSIHRVLVTASSAATAYKLRFVYGTGTMADAITAKQYSEVMFIRESGVGRGDIINIKMPRLAVDTKIWCQAWNAADNATIDFLVGVHEHDSPETP